MSEKINEIRDENGELVENRHVNLLLTEKEGKYHYSTISSFSRLVRSQVSKRKQQQFLCYRCLHGFIRQDLLDSHVKLCNKVAVQRITMPSVKDSVLKFTNIQKQLPAYFRVYADFECILKEQDVETSPIGISEDGNSKTVRYQEHIPCSYAYKVVSSVPEYQPELKLSNVSENAAKDFLTDIQHVADHIMNEYILKQKAKPRLNQLTVEQRHYILMLIVIYVREQYVQDITFLFVNVVYSIIVILLVNPDFGKFRGPAHNTCNLQFKIDPKTWKLPIIIHNFQGYGSHLIVKALEKANGTVKVIPNNME